jgi:hypothetical protein
MSSGKFNRRNILLGGATLAASTVAPNSPVQVAQAQPRPAGPPAGSGKPNIIMLVSDDFGYGDAGAYLGGEARGMPTPNIDRLAVVSPKVWASFNFRSAAESGTHPWPESRGGIGNAHIAIP